MVEAFPYIGIVFLMTLLITPFVKRCPGISIKKMYSYGIQQVSSSYILVFFAYAIYIIFAIFKEIDIDIGSTDAYYYMTYYNEIPSSFKLYISEITTFEPGYSSVTWAFKQITKEYKIMLLFWHSLTFILIIKFLRNINLEKHSFLPVFIILFILISQFNTLRMSISITIALIALTYLNEEKWIKSFIAIIIAISMQVSAVIMIPVWMLYFLISKKNKYPIRQLLIYTAIAFIITIFSIKYATGVIANTAKSTYLDESSLAIGTYLAVFAIFTFSIIKYKDMVELNKFNKLLILMLPICFLCIPLQYNMAIMYRLTLFFIPVMMALIPSLCQCYLKNKNSALGFAVVSTLYIYMLYRAYSFFTEEIIYIGPYTNTLFFK